MQSPAPVAATLPNRSTGVTVTAGGLAADADGYLLCFDGGTSWRRPLPDPGTILIGRGGDADVVFADATVSRHHARIDIAPDWLEITDLGSRHGTQVNGRPVRGSQPLASGDLIAIGSAVVVVRQRRRLAAAPPLLATAGLRARVAEEIARARPHRAEVLVVCLAGDAAVDGPRVWAAIAALAPPGTAAGRSHDDRLIVVSHGEAGVAERLLAAARPWLGGARAGVARSPADGVDADALLAAASAAATAASPGTITAAAAAITTLTVGAHQVVIADPAMLRAYELLRRLARHDLPVLIGGETGTGKELAAAAIHHFSRRAAGPLVAVLEAADGGTLFLDEIGELPPATQAKLLRALETQRVVRVGEVEERAIDVRIVAATHRDLAADSAAGRFRADLYYRIGAARVVLPPLRDRPREIPILAQALLDGACAQMGRGPLTLAVAATHALCDHGWPGNVRELRNAMAVAATATELDEDTVEVWHLPAELGAADPIAADPLAPAAAPSGARPAEFAPIADEVRALERRRMTAALRACAGQQNQAAALIAMPLRTFVTKLKRYDIQAADWATRVGAP